MLLKSYTKAGAATLATNLLQAATGFANVWLLTATIGIHEVGVLLLAVSIVSVPTFLLTSVVERPAFLRMSRLGVAPDAEFSDQRIAGAALVGSVAIGAAITVMLWLAAPVLSELFGMASLSDWLRLLCFLPVALAGWTTLSACRQARQDVVLAMLGGTGLQAIALTALYFVAYAVWPERDAIAAALTLANILPCCFLLWRAPVRITSPLSEFSGDEMIYGVRLSVVRLLTHADMSLDVWFVGLFASGEGVAVYSVGKQLTRLLGMGKAAIDSLLVPRVGRLMAEGNRNNAIVQREMRTSRALGFGACILALAVLAPLSPMLTRILGGYEAAVPIMLVLAARHMVETGTGTVGQLVIMRGLAKAILNMTIISALLFLISAIALGAMLGPIGVAVGTLVGTVFRNGLALRLADQLVGIKILTWNTGTTVAISSLIVACLGIAGVPWNIWATLAAALVALALTMTDIFHIIRRSGSAPEVSA